MITRKEEYLLKRRRKGISQSYLARKLNCNQSLISRFEKDECTMSRGKIEKYMQIIDK